MPSQKVSIDDQLISKIEHRIHWSEDNNTQISDSSKPSIYKFKPLPQLSLPTDVGQYSRRNRYNACWGGRWLRWSLPSRTADSNWRTSSALSLISCAQLDGFPLAPDVWEIRQPWRSMKLEIYLLVVLLGVLSTFSYPGISDWNACWDICFLMTAPSWPSSTL